MKIIWTICVSVVSSSPMFTLLVSDVHATKKNNQHIKLITLFFIVTFSGMWPFQFGLIPEVRADVSKGNACIKCHQIRKPGIHQDWEKSVHAKVGVSCYTCHVTDKKSGFFSKDHLKFDVTPVTAIVSPQKCAGCHPEEAKQYEKSKHAHTQEIIWKVDHWLNDGMNNAVERTSGCYPCHGTVVKVFDGKPLPGTWPNVGVGRINPDGSRGCCSSCHTRHRFSVVEARKPEACDQCHLGPDHPQIEIYNESKHGTIYHAEGDEWNWDPDDHKWKVGRDFRAPTCAVCHMSAVGKVQRTHDVTERLSWETQAPLTIRPSEFKPLPADTDWKTERKKMQEICLQCHSQTWTDNHFLNFDNVVSSYNELYYEPIQKLMDKLYNDGLLSKDKYFDEELEWQFYEFWHYEGRRARMGAAMMAPDYAWWHGFYELKYRYNYIKKEASKLRKEGRAEVYTEFPGKYRE